MSISNINYIQHITNNHQNFVDANQQQLYSSQKQKITISFDCKNNVFDTPVLTGLTPCRSHPSLAVGLVSSKQIYTHHNLQVQLEFAVYHYCRQ